MIESHVTNLEISQKLKELGVPQKAYFTWYTNADDAHLTHNPEGFRGFEEKSFDAFLASELFEILPERIYKTGDPSFLAMWKRLTGQLAVKYKPNEGRSRIPVKMGTPADALGKMLIYLLENKLIALEEITKSDKSNG